MTDVKNWTANITYESELCYWIENIVGGPTNITAYHIWQLLQAYRDASYPYPTAIQVYGCLYYYRDDIPNGNIWTGCDF